MLPFTFEIVDDQPPKITIDGKALSVVNCVFFWSTATELTVCMSTAIVCGFLDGEINQRNFRLIFSRREAIEFIN